MKLDASDFPDNIPRLGPDPQKQTPMLGFVCKQHSMEVFPGETDSERARKARQEGEEVTNNMISGKVS